MFGTWVEQRMRYHKRSDVNWRFSNTTEERLNGFEVFSNHEIGAARSPNVCIGTTMKNYEVNQHRAEAATENR